MATYGSTPTPLAAATRVLAQIADLVAYIEQLNIAKGISNALDVKLDAAARALSDINAQNDAQRSI